MTTNDRRTKFKSKVGGFQKILWHGTETKYKNLALGWRDNFLATHKSISHRPTHTTSPALQEFSGGDFPGGRQGIQTPLPPFVMFQFGDLWVYVRFCDHQRSLCLCANSRCGGLSPRRIPEFGTLFCRCPRTHQSHAVTRRIFGPRGAAELWH